MRVYQLMALEHGIQNLKRSRLKVATIEDLNDPFELLPAKLPQRALRDAIRNYKADMHGRFGLLCFCRTWKNPVVWSHYADKHRGVCLGFEVPDQFLIPVNYVSSRIAMRFATELPEKRLDPTFGLDMIRTKFKDWAHEDEVRMFVSLEEVDVDSGLYFQSFDDKLILKEIVLGDRCGVDATEIRRLTSVADPSVSVSKARLAFNSFRVVPNRSVRVG